MIADGIRPKTQPCGCVTPLLYFTAITNFLARHNDFAYCPITEHRPQLYPAAPFKFRTTKYKLLLKYPPVGQNHINTQQTVVSKSFLLQHVHTHKLLILSECLLYRNTSLPLKIAIGWEIDSNNMHLTPLHDNCCNCTLASSQMLFHLENEIDIRSISSALVKQFRTKYCT
jgi:hypothetical protein